MNSSKALLLAAAVGALGTPAAAQERIAAPAIGFDIEMPKGWHRLAADEAVANLSHIQLDSPALRRVVAEGGPRPLVSFTKYPLSHGGLIPALKLFMEPRSKFGGADGPRAVALLADAYKSVLTDVEMLDPPSAVQLAGQSAGHLRLRHQITASGGRMAAIAEVWFVARGQDMFQVNLSYGENASPEAIAELRAAAASLRLTPSR